MATQGKQMESSAGEAGVTREQILAAVREAAILPHKPALRFPTEVMLYLGLGETATRRFVRTHNIKLREFDARSGAGENLAKFVRRADVDRALDRCGVVGGRPRAAAARMGGPRQPAPGSRDAAANDNPTGEV